MDGPTVYAGIAWIAARRRDAMPFRLEHITLTERVELGCRGLLYAGQYGLVPDVAAALGTSRQFLYTLRARAGGA